MRDEHQNMLIGGVSDLVSSRLVRESVSRCRVYGAPVSSDKKRREPVLWKVIAWQSL